MSVQTGPNHPLTIQLEDDGNFPNSVLPLLIYRRTNFSAIPDLASSIERRFSVNDWTNFWRDEVYSFAHYHSTTHEALAVFRGTATLEFGGPKNGSDIVISCGDVIVIPAGVAHRQKVAARDFKVVGAYPQGRSWDIVRGAPGERPAALARIAELPLPETDPLFGANGPLTSLWRSAITGAQDC